MSIRLRPDQYASVKHLLTCDNRHYPLLEAVLDGDMQGGVYADVLENPRAALVRGKLNWLYMIGDDESPEIIETALSILPEGDRPCLWFGIPDAWRGRLAGLSATLTDHPRYRFRFDRGAFMSLPEPPPPPVPVEAISGENYEMVNKSIYIQPLWRDRERFFEKGFGFFLRDGDTILSSIFTASVSSGEAEVQIVTHADYRGKGYGSLLAIAYVRECLRRGLAPKWDCMAGNAASLALAKKLGFRVVSEYPVAEIRFGA